MRGTVKDRFEDKIFYSPDGCWYWTGAKLAHYGGFRLDVNLYTLAHRASWLIYNGDIPIGLNICHTCDNTLCVNPNHLFIGTQYDNMRDCSKKKRFDSRIPPMGKEHYKSKFTDENIRDIRALQYILHASILARMFGVTISAIRAIQYRRTWKHISSTQI